MFPKKVYLISSEETKTWSNIQHHNPKKWKMGYFPPIGNNLSFF